MSVVGAAFVFLGVGSLAGFLGGYHAAWRSKHLKCVAWYADGRQSGYLDGLRTQSGRTNAVGVERDRLAHLLRRHDTCRCGMPRHEHEGGGIAFMGGRCTGFVVATPADDLETVVEGERPETVGGLGRPHVLPNGPRRLSRRTAPKIDLFDSQAGFSTVREFSAPPMTEEAVRQVTRAGNEIFDQLFVPENVDAPPAECSSRVIGPSGTDLASWERAYEGQRDEGSGDGSGGDSSIDEAMQAAWDKMEPRVTYNGAEVNA